MWTYNYTDELYHHGVLGMKWGKRRYQNKDGSLTPAGEKRYAKMVSKAEKKYAKAGIAAGKAAYYKKAADDAAKEDNDRANLYERQAKAWDSKGQVLLAEGARRTAEHFRSRAADARAKYDEEAAYYMMRSEKLKQKASDFAKKKQVDIGKKKVDDILKKAKKDGFDDEAFLEEWSRDFEKFRSDVGTTDD